MTHWRKRSQIESPLTIFAILFALVVMVLIILGIIP